MFIDPRYTTDQSLARAENRETVRAIDRFSGTGVVIKALPIGLACREAEALLTLPRGVAPGLKDILPLGPHEIALVQEEARGRSLLEAAATLDAASLPSLVCAIADLLTTIHRSGWVHVDLKPNHIFVDETDGRLRVRLLDFGFALNLYSGHWVGGQAGGTPPFLAPEVIAGWDVDGRADLYSLGVTLATLFPDLEGDPDWAPILESLRRRLPADRPASARELRDIVAARLALGKPVSRPPEFPSGPMHGRDEELQEARTLLEAGGSRLLLVQGRPRSGVTRFLLELSLALARDGRPVPRLLDLTGQTVQDAASPARLLQDLRTGDETLVVGIPDPTADCRHLDPRLRRLLHEEAAAPPARLLLRPLDAPAYGDITASTLGTGGPGADSLADALHAATDGDLGAADEGFDLCIRSLGRETDLGWDLDPVTADGPLDGWKPKTHHPEWADLPEAQRKALAALARLGPTFSRSSGEDLLETHATGESLQGLLDCGLLDEIGGKVRFVPRWLWNQAWEESPSRREEIDRWIHREVPPDLDDAPAVILAAQRAQRLGDLESERAIIAEALLKADRERRWASLRALLFYPGSPPSAPKEVIVVEAMEGLNRFLGPGWSLARLLRFAGESFRGRDSKLRRALLERVVEQPDLEESLLAVFHLLDSALKRNDEVEVSRLEERMRKLQEAGATPPAGISEYYQAWRIIAQKGGGGGKLQELARRATEGLKSSGLWLEPISYQLLAISLFGEDPDNGIRSLEMGLSKRIDPETEAQMRHNLYVMYTKRGMLQEAEACLTEGLARLHGRISLARLLQLRVSRAQTRTERNLIDEAEAEAYGILRYVAARTSAHTISSLRAVLSYCLLHRHLAPTALAQLVRRWRESEGNMAHLFRLWELMPFASTVYHLEAWDAIRAYGDTLRVEGETEDAEARVGIAMMKAVHSQASGDLQEACRLLKGVRAIAEANDPPSERRDYLFCLAEAHRALAESRGSRTIMEEADSMYEATLSILPAEHLIFWRASTLLGRARCRWQLGDGGGGRDSLDECLDLTRRHRMLGLRRKALEFRAQWEMS